MQLEREIHYNLFLRTRVTQEGGESKKVILDVCPINKVTVSEKPRNKEFKNFQTGGSQIACGREITFIL